MRLRILALVGVLIASGLSVVLLPGAASAGCPPETFYKRSGPSSRIWMGTSEYSYAKPGPGDIIYTKETSASVTATVSASFSVSVGVIASASAEVGVSLARSTSHSDSWSYSIHVPRGMTARGHVFKRAYKIPTKKIQSTPTCTSVVTRGYTYAPVRSNNNRYYCIARDRGAPTKIMDSAKCVNI